MHFRLNRVLLIAILAGILTGAPPGNQVHAATPSAAEVCAAPKAGVCAPGCTLRDGACQSIFPPGQGLPANAYLRGDGWACRTGFRKNANACVDIFAGFPNGQPANSFVIADEWFCNQGFEKVDQACRGLAAPNTVVALEAQPPAAPAPEASAPDAQAPVALAPVALAPTRPEPPARPAPPATPQRSNTSSSFDPRPPAVNRAPLDPRDLFAVLRQSVWLVVAFRDVAALKSGRDVAQGSAVAVSRRHLLTNCHVIEDQNTIALIQDDEVLEAKRFRVRSQTDRCVLIVDRPVLRPVPGVRASSDLDVGERSFTLGAPSGLELTFADGLVSAVRRTDTVTYVQSTAPISPGSSGGGLFDGAGNLIGITTMLLRDTQNLNFSIAAEEFWR